MSGTRCARLATTDVAGQGAAELVEVSMNPTGGDRSRRRRSSGCAHVEGRKGAFDDGGDAAQRREVGRPTRRCPPERFQLGRFDRGDVDKGFAEAAEIVELEIASQTVHQRLYRDTGGVGRSRLVGPLDGIHQHAGEPSRSPEGRDIARDSDRGCQHRGDRSAAGSAENSS